jgi:hypothetical protein
MSELYHWRAMKANGGSAIDPSITGAVVNTAQAQYRSTGNRQKFGYSANYRKKHTLAASKPRLGGSFTTHCAFY